MSHIESRKGPVQQECPLMSDLISHTRWVTTLAAGLATATVSLPPIAVETVEMKALGVTAFVILGVSAWCGTQAAKLYVAYQLPVKDLVEMLGVPEATEQVMVRKITALRRGSRWALIQQFLFVVGGVLAAVFFVVNL